MVYNLFILAKDLEGRKLLNVRSGGSGPVSAVVADCAIGAGPAAEPENEKEEEKEGSDDDLASSLP